MSEAIRIRMLGPFEARRPDGSAIAPPGRRSVALLACLALRDDATSTRPRLASLLWHDRAPEQANGSLRQELLRLRRAFDERLALPTAEPPVPVPRLSEDAVEIDVLRFEQAAAEPARAGEAAGLYRGPLLQDFPLGDDPFSTWLGQHRRRLHALAAGSLLRVLRGPEASDTAAQRLLELDPVCEEAYRFLIRAHAARGDRGRAQAAYHACAAQLRKRLGREPSQETRALLEFVDAELSVSSISMFGIMPGSDRRGTDWIEELRRGPNALRVPEPRSLPLVEDRPSVAVLPFTDLTNEARLLDDRFADGVTEETTNALARMPGFFVTSRHSAMAYRNAAMDARLIASQLGVRYLVEGSVERAGGLARGNVRLIDGRTGLHLWADGIDGPVADAFALRDRLVREIATRLQPRLLLSEMHRALRAPPPNPDAWTWLLRAQSELAQQHDLPETLARSETALQAALQAEPDYAMAHAMLANILTLRHVSRAGGSVIRGRWRAQQAMKRALLLDPTNPVVLSFCSEAALYSAGDIDHAGALLERALQRDPNDANALALLGNIRRMVGDDPRIGLTLIEQAMRRSPRDPRSAFWFFHAAWCHWKLGDFVEMEGQARRGLELYRGSPWNWVCLASALGLQGRSAEARDAAAVIRELMPGFSAGGFYWTARFFYGRRFSGHIQAGYAELRRVLKVALA